MTSTTYVTDRIVPRDRLDFHITEQTPRWWYGNDAYKTRFLDAMQAAFPDGERYFITSVQAFKDQITDPKMVDDVRNFIRQEGQHTAAHSRYNDLLRKQGVAVDRVINETRDLFARYTKRFSARYNLALTAAYEHFTALMAETMFGIKSTMGPADPNMRALWAWHAIEEMEHKSVTFDVMQQVAKVGYFMRCLAMTHVVVEVLIDSLRRATWLLKGDGFGPLRRFAMSLKGCAWLFKPTGLYGRCTGRLFAYYLPGFHPNKLPIIHSYPVWLKVFEESGDPLRAGAALFAAAH
jgi:predicted metal-dependent hydrolase